MNRVDNKTPLLSVVVPVYNASNILARCIDSILDNTYQNLEVILVDDGSKDDSGKICDEYAQKDCRIRVFHQKNHGQGMARNTGLDMAKGDYITFVDDDDYIESRMYEKLIECALTNDTAITGCSRITEYEDGRSINNFDDRQEGIISGRSCVLDILLQNKHAWGAMWDKIYKAELFEGVRFPDASLEDYVVVLQLYYQTEKIYFCADPMYHYSFYQGSTSKKGFFPKKITSLDMAERIRMYFIDQEADKEILSAADEFVFMIYLNLLWEIRKQKPQNWKQLIQTNKIKAKHAFHRYIKNCNRRRGDCKKTVKFFLIMLSA